MDTTKTLLNSLPQEQAPTFFERVLLGVLSKLHGGGLVVTLPSGLSVRTGGEGPECADIRILDPKTPKRLLTGGAMAFAETWMEGGWETTDLSALLRLLAKGQPAIGPVARGASRVLRAMDHAAHSLRKNTPENARKNIREHYDLSNDLYAAFLDPSLTYSAALFSESGEELLPAQLRKIDRMIGLMDPKPGDHVLEIGSGWGACAIRLAQTRGCRVTSLTLSDEQAREARARVEKAGLGHLVEIRLQDYRDVTETFDHVISVEMIEAVGHEFLPVYFQTVDERLKPGGRFLLQAITIPDERYRDYCRSSDFIRKHIFPGGHLPSPGVITEHIREHTRLRETNMLEFGAHYAETLRRWRDAFTANRRRVQSLGFDETFHRKWLYYFSYCEAGFDTGMIHVRQYSFEKQTS